MVAALASKPLRRFTPQEYLLVERAAEIKSEYLDGQMYGMAGASPEHNIITANLIAELRAPLRRAGCRTFASDQRIAIAPEGSYYYPDVSAVCGEAKFLDKHRDTLLNPALIVEVLSKSAAKYDREIKLAEYQGISSVREILLVSQDRLRVEHYSRSGKHWIARTHSRPDAILDIPSLHCSLALSEIYDGVTFS
ncbi:MAG: Uma2 family endonuclease [Bryobacteraceae bacterium]